MASCMDTMIKIVINIFLFPIYLACSLIFVLVYVGMTMTGIGPLIQYCYKMNDNKLLNRKILLKQPDMFVIEIPPNLHSVTNGLPYSVFIRFTKPQQETSYPPVCITNGLGATLVIISKIHEALVEHGFTVLSYDRLGVGFSDDNKTGKSPTAEDIINEMDFVMTAVLPKQTKWILLGPSMGSIIAQCYIARYPEKVAGFLNMDGLPYPFIQQREQFIKAASIYRIYTYIIWTGILRPFIPTGIKTLEDAFKSKGLGIKYAIAQLNQSKFYGNLALELVTMMDCCKYAEQAWGNQSLLKLNRPKLEVLIRAPPTRSVTIDKVTHASTVTSFRSASELHDTWSDSNSVLDAVHALLNNTAALTDHSEAADQSSIKPVQSPLLKWHHEQETYSYSTTSQLAETWSRLVVRVMSARNHDFGSSMANSFYTTEMKEMAAAEHAIHTLLAKNGERTVYPKINHSMMFAETKEIVRNIIEIGDVLLASP